MTDRKFINWLEIDVKTGKPLSNNRKVTGERWSIAAGILKGLI